MLWEIWLTVTLLFELIGILCALEAVYLARSAQGAIAWCVALITFPWLGVPLYLIFGKFRFSGYRDLGRQFTAVRKERLRRSMGQVALASAVRDAHLKEASADSGLEKPAISLLERLAELPFLSGNEVSLLIDGDATFEALYAAIHKARRYILFQAYIVRDDEIGRNLLKELSARARAGVRVYFLYDQIGCYNLPREYIEELSASGVEAHSFDTTRGIANKFQINFRNHRKITVIDGRIAFLGGHNVGLEYVGREERFGHWRDTHLKIEGPAVIPVQAAFFSDWFWATSKRPALNWLCPPRHADQKVLIFASGPNDTFQRCSLFFIELINSARERLWIASPYFVPEQAVLSALQLASLRGVDVRILLPGISDVPMVRLAALSFLTEMKDSGARIFFYRNGFLHEKVVLVDKKMAGIGTANLDNRSMRLNFEITALVADEHFNARVAEMLEKDLAESREEERRFEDLPIATRVAARFASLFSPIL